MLRKLIRFSRDRLAMGALAAYLAAQSTSSVVSQQRQPPVLLSLQLGVRERADGEPSAPVVVTLTHRLVGSFPAHYRVSPRPDLLGATWLPYAALPMWAGALVPGTPCQGRLGAGTLLRLYFQVRAVLGQDIRVIQGQRVLVPTTSESNVLSGELCVVPTAGQGGGT
jgi:hypothetical protein